MGETRAKIGAFGELCPPSGDALNLHNFCVLIPDPANPGRLLRARVVVEFRLVVEGETDAPAQAETAPAAGRR